MKNNRNATRRMVISAMLSAITAVLTFTPIGMIPLPPPLLSVTTVHIPVIVAVLAEGPMVGLLVGLVFGLCSLIRAFTSGMTGLTLFFCNPLISVLPRLMVPLITWGFHWLWQRLTPAGRITEKAGWAVSAVVGSVANTVTVLGMIVLLYESDLTTLLNEMIAAGNADAAYLSRAGAWLVAAVGLPNGIAEAIAAGLIVPVVLAAVKAVVKRSNLK